MKVLLLVFLASSVPLFAQIERDKDDFSVETIANYAYYTDFGSKTSFGLQAELMLSKNFGFQMSAAGNQNYITFNGPALLVPLGILIADKEGSDRDVISLIEIIFLACVVENPALHIKINDRFELVTYASLCRIRYWWSESAPFASSWMASGSVGLKVNYSFSPNWYINMNGEYSQIYYSGRPKGFQLGIAIGKIIKPK